MRFTVAVEVERHIRFVIARVKILKPLREFDQDQGWDWTFAVLAGSAFGFSFSVCSAPPVPALASSRAPVSRLLRFGS